MLVIVGVGLLMACVFGSFIADGGAIGPVLEAAPFELLSIGGAAMGSLVISGSVNDLKHTFGGMVKAIKGSRFKKQSYIELLTLMYQLMRLASSKGLVAIEPHIERPEESAIFKAFPLILKDHHATAMISDYLRMVGMNADDPHQIEDVMARELKRRAPRNCTHRTRCRRCRTACRRSGSSPPCSASSRPWATSTRARSSSAT